MNSRIISSLSLFVLMSFGLSCQQKQTLIIPEYDIQKLAPIQKHYKELALLDKSANANLNELDAVKFHSKKYGWIAKLLQPAYLTKAQLKDLYLELQPPANSSDQTRAELDFLLDLQSSRSVEQIEEIQKLHDIVHVPLIKRNESDLMYLCSTVIGRDITGKTNPETVKLLNNIMKEMRIIEFSAKNHFLRARPRQLESRLAPLQEMNTSSFASGHTLWAYLQAYILAELIPDKADAFLQLAFEIGFSRELLGVHYPSDEEASRKLAHRMLQKMWKTKSFQRDFKSAKEEWREQKSS